MADRVRPRLHRAQLSAEERALRSRLAQLVTSQGFVRGTLSVRERVCGRSNCRCASGQRHRALYLVASHDGKLQQLYVPHSLERTVEQWVATYKDLRELLEELSQRQWDKLRRREP
jgi:hypothetical protein